MTSPTPSLETNTSSASMSDAEADPISTKCGICLSTYHLPKLLSCFHTFCQSCLESIMVSDVITCPLCKCETRLATRNIQDLTSDYPMMNALEMEAIEKSLGICKSCKGLEGKELTARCLDCATLLCGACQAAHNTMHRFSNHRIHGLNELKSGGVLGSLVVKCEVHKHLNLEYFCFSPRCNGPRCKECLILCRMQTHDYHHLDDVMDRKVEELFNLLRTVMSKESLLRATSDNIRNSTIGLKTQYETAKSGIFNTYRSYCELLLERRDSLLRDLDTAYGAQEVILNNAMQELNIAKSNTSSVMQFINRATKYVSKMELLMFNQMIEAKLNPVIDYVPTINAPNTFRIQFVSEHQTIQAAVQNSFGYLEQTRNDPSSALDYGQLLDSLENLSILSGNQQTMVAQQIAKIALSGQMESALAMLKPSPSASTYCTGDSSVSDFSNHWMGKSEDIFSKADMFQAGLVDPGSTRVSSGTSSSPRSLVVRNKMAYHVKFGEYGSGESQFSEPSGVAVNVHGDILVADTNNHRIQVFDRGGVLKFQFGEGGKQDGQLLYPNRVSVCPVTGHIVVTERSPTHQVQIFTEDGKFVRKFGSAVLMHPRGLTVDYQGRILVVECKVMRVFIFNHYGNILHRFNCSSHLQFPNSIATNDKNEIFISDNRLHCVLVFNYTGEWLRQIGCNNITNYPIGVGINRKGEIVITDNHNNFNVTVFSQEGEIKYGLESKVKHAQCFDVALGEEGTIVLASKDFRIYVYRYSSAGCQQNMMVFD